MVWGKEFARQSALAGAVLVSGCQHYFQEKYVPVSAEERTQLEALVGRAQQAEASKKDSGCVSWVEYPTDEEPMTMRDLSRFLQLPSLHYHDENCNGALDDGDRILLTDDSRTLTSERPLDVWLTRRDGQFLARKSDEMPPEKRKEAVKEFYSAVLQGE